MAVMARSGYRVVRADGAARQVDEALQRLKEVLQDWAEWNRGYRMRLGFPARAACGCGEAVRDSDDVRADADSAMFEAVDAAVDDLTPAQQAAVYRCYGLAAVYRFPRDNYPEQLEQAHDVLCRKLPRRGVELVK